MSDNQDNKSPERLEWEAPSAQDLDETIRRLAMNGSTDQDICEYLIMDESNLSRKYGDMLVQVRAWRRIALREKQTAVALKGNAGVLTLLGKHELGQTTTPAPADDYWPEPQLGPKVG